MIADRLYARIRPLARRLWPPAAFALILLARQAWPERSLSATGPAALWDHAFALAFTFFLLLAAARIGRWLLTKLQLLDGMGSIQGWTYSLATGLGGLGLALMALGLVGLLKPLWIAILITGMLLVRSSLDEAAPSMRERIARISSAWSGMTPIGRLALLLITSIGLTSVAHALTPAWSFDALMYHLEAPRRYLQAGRLLLLPDIWQANGPMAVELLYAAGLAFGSSSVARLLHFVMTSLLALAAFGFAREHLGSRYASTAAILLVGIPILPIWASIANIDSGWALFEALALFSAVHGISKSKSRWLYLSGILVGLAMTTKYLALAGLLSVAILLLIAKARSGALPTRTLAGFSAAAIVVGAPWYILNVVRAGNPIYPFLFGGPEWTPDRIAYLTTYLGSFGGPNQLISFLLAPLWLFSRNDLYASFISSLEYPSFLFPLALALPMVRADKPVRWLGLALLLRFALWGATSQQTRFLLPLYPGLAVLTAVVLHRGLSALVRPSTQRAIIVGLLGGLITVTLVFQVILWRDMLPGGVLIGTRSKDDFLRRNSETYAAQNYIMDQLPTDARVLMMFDGQGFYCDQRCVVDAEQSKWTQLVAQGASTAQVEAALRERGITHLLARNDSLNFFLQHDPRGWHTEAIRFYLQEFRPECSEAVYQSGGVTVERISCS